MENTVPKQKMEGVLTQILITLSIHTCRSESLYPESLHLQFYSSSVLPTQTFAHDAKAVHCSFTKRSKRKHELVQHG